MAIIQRQDNFIADAQPFAFLGVNDGEAILGAVLVKENLDKGKITVTVFFFLKKKLKYRNTNTVLMTGESEAAYRIAQNKFRDKKRITKAKHPFAFSAS